MKDKTCPICGTIFLVKVSHFDKRITCSKECMKIHYRTTLAGPSNPHWKGGKVPLYCHSCGKCRKSGTKGTNNPNWRGGLKTLNDTIRSSDKMKLWIKEVFQSDNYSCFYCKAKGDLQAHHIVPFSAILLAYKFFRGDLNVQGLLEYPPLWDISNGVALCPACHKKFPNQIIDDTLTIPDELLIRALPVWFKIAADSIQVKG